MRLTPLCSRNGCEEISRMIIPVGHENLRGRRWPWVTTIIILLCALFFLITISPMEEQLVRMTQAEYHIVLLSAAFPDAPITPAASKIVRAFKAEHMDFYQEMGSPDRNRFVDEWDKKIHGEDYSASDANAEMTALCSQLAQAQANSIAWRYAFHSVDPSARSYITATFLHGGWLHIIFNMWFLWLAGTILEDLWGRIIYPTFYLAAGAFAWAVHGAVYPHSFMPALGASGAIAALMGAFLVRFPTTRIRLGWVLWVKIIKFNVPAYIILPLWLLMNLSSGMLARLVGVEGGVAYWAHIGGFAFGALGAYLLRTSGLEQSADRAIEARVSWTADPLIVRATDSLAENNPAGAIATLRQHLQEKPESVDGWDLLFKAQERKKDLEGQKETLAALCRLRVMAGELQAAAADYEMYKNLGGDKLPRGVWLEICRYHEREQHWELAAGEYEKLAQTYPSERAALSALVSAGHIYVTNLRSPGLAEKLLKLAQSSPLPHSDLDAAIQEGLKKCAPAPVQQVEYLRY
jgi:membrane associated rhomboid family serine protease